MAAQGPNMPWQAPPREQWPMLAVRRATGLYLGVVQDRAFAHNPWGHDALALLSARASALLNAADGRPAGELAQALCGGDGAASAAMLEELPMLLRNGFLQAPDVLPWRPQGPAERVFNTWVHLTNACNLACPYCYIHKDKHHMGGDVTARVLAAIEATARSGEVDRIHVRFAGGEPMLRFEDMQRFFTDATVICQSHGVKFGAAILTNGTVVPKGATDWIRAHGVQVSVSVDGVGTVQDVMRPVVGGGSSFARLQDGLDAYLTAGIRPYILVTIGDSNLDGLVELTQWLLARKLGFRYSLVRDLEWGAGLLDDRQGASDAAGMNVELDAPAGLLSGEPLRRVQRVLGQCYDLIEAAVARGEADRPSFRATHKFCDLEPWRPIAKACGAGDTYVAIADTGEVSPCQAALHHPGTQPIRADNLFRQAREQTQLGTFRRESGNPECNRCRFKASCAGGCPLLLYRREGHIDGRSPYCEVFRAVLPRILRIGALELLMDQRRRRA